MDKVCLTINLIGCGLASLLSVAMMPVIFVVGGLGSGSPGMAEYRMVYVIAVMWVMLLVPGLTILGSIGAWRLALRKQMFNRGLAVCVVVAVGVVFQPGSFALTLFGNILRGFGF